MSRLFVSYSRGDAEFVRRVAGDLRAAGVNLWVDQEDIPPGERWDHAIETALNDADGILVVLSPISATSQNVLDEISYALDTGKRIVPVVCARCPIPFRLRRLQYIDFTDQYDVGLKHLLKAIKRPIPSGLDSSSRQPADAGAAVNPPGAAHRDTADRPSAPLPRNPRQTPAGDRQGSSESAAPTAPSVDHASAPPLERSRVPVRYVVFTAAIVLVIVALAGYWRLGSSPPEVGSKTDNDPAPAAVMPAPAALRSEANPAAATPKAAKTSTDGRYTVHPCGAIADSKSGLEWFIGPDRNMTWDEAARWISSLDACGGSWQMPTIEQLAALYDQRSTAGTGFISGGRTWPAHLDPVFDAIGQGSWAWSRDTRDVSTARSFNLNQGTAAQYDRNNATFSTRAFAVRAARASDASTRPAS